MIICHTLRMCYFSYSFAEADKSSTDTVSRSPAAIVDLLVCRLICRSHHHSLLDFMYVRTGKAFCHCRITDVCVCVAVYLDRVHRPGNKAVLVHCIELPEFTKARMYISS